MHSHNILHRSSLASIGSLDKKRVLSPIQGGQDDYPNSAKGCHTPKVVELNTTNERFLASSFISKDGEDSESIKDALDQVP